MSKKIVFRYILPIVFLMMLTLAFSACNNMSGVSRPNNNKGNVYLKVDVASVGRTALPDFPNVNSISDFTFILTGKGPGDSELTPLATETNSSGEYASLSALQSASFPIQAGDWTFKLTASKEGTTLSDEISETITSGSNTLSFDLKWEDTNLDETKTGSLSFELDFSAAPNQSSVTYATTELLKYDSSTASYTVTSTETSIGFTAGKVIYAPSDLASGNYKLLVRLYGKDTNTNNTQPILLFTWTELAIITGGQESKGSRSVSSLNELYTITWHNLDQTGVTSPETLPGCFSRFSQAYTLPVSGVSRTGTIFGGWYSDADYQTPITELPANSSGTKDIYARFIDTIYIKDGGVAYTDGVDGTRESTALDSIDSAISKIIEYAEPSVNWKIVVMGEIKGLQNIGNALTTTDNAASLTIMGKTGNSTDSLNANLSSPVENGITLIVNTAVPLTLQNIKITGGNNSLSLGPGALDIAAEGASVNLVDILISGNIKSGCLINVREGTSLTLTSGDIIGSVGTGNSTGSGVISSGTFTMLGGTIKKNNSNNGGGVRISSGIFRFGGGTICQNSAASGYGGGVRVAGGTMFMYGDAVIGDDSKTVYATSDTVCSNYAKLAGGLYLEGNVGSGDANCYIGYYDADTPRECTGGIYYNYSTNSDGGGVSVNHGKLVINTGNIKYNGSAQTVGGISFSSQSSASLEIAGGEISGNKGNAFWGNDISLQGSIYFPVDDDGNNTISGNITVTGALTPPAECTDGIVAKFSFGDSNVGTQAVSVKTGSGLDLAAVCQQFASDNSIYYIADDGIVHSIPVVASVDGTRYYSQETAYNAIKNATGSNVPVVLDAGCDANILGLSATEGTLANAIKLTSATINLSVASGVIIALNEDSSSMFASCSKLVSADLRGFDTSNTTAIANMFWQCSNLASVDLSTFNTSNVTSMCFIFQDCSSLTSIDVTNFDTSNCGNIHGMFDGCSALASIDVSNFNTTAAQSFTNMFSGCSSLTQLNLISFDTGGRDVTTYWMFANCTNLQTIIVSSAFDVTNVENSEDMFKDCQSLKGGYSSAPTQWDSSNPTDKTYARIDGGTSSPGYFSTAIAKVGDTFCKNTTEAANAIGSATGDVTITLYRGAGLNDLGNAGTAGTIAYAIKNNTTADSFRVIVPANANIAMDLDHAGSFWKTLFYECTKLVYADLRGLDTSNETNLETTFYGCTNLQEVILSSFNTSNVTDMTSMFSGCSNLKTIKVGPYFVTGQVTSSDNMFDGCSALVGGNGTTFDSSMVDKTYARDDRDGSPGYFTQISYIGDKPSPNQVGDIVFLDGSAKHYDGTSLSDEEKAAAIAVIFYAGPDLNNGGDTTTVRVLGTPLSRCPPQNKPWCTNEANAYSTKIESITCSYQCDETLGTYTFNGDKDGRDNLNQIASELSEDDTYLEDKYPAFWAAKNYGSGITNMAGTAYEDGWYLPTDAELYEVYKFWKEGTLDEIVTLITGTGFGISDSQTFISSTQHSGAVYFVYVQFFASQAASIAVDDKASIFYYICPIYQFSN